MCANDGIPRNNLAQFQKGRTTEKRRRKKRFKKEDISVDIRNERISSMVYKLKW